MTTLYAGTYIVKGDISINNQLEISGDVNLIFADGAQLNITGDGIYIDSGPGNINSYTLNIYAQSAGTGKLTITTPPYQSAIFVGEGDTLNIYGGQITATSQDQTAVFASMNASITIGWTNATDFIDANSYGGNITIADGKRFYDAAGNVYGAGDYIPSGKLNALDGFIVTVPDGVTVDGGKRIGDTNKYICAGEVTLKAAQGYTLDKVTVDGTTISGNTFKVSSDVEIAAEVTAIVAEDTFNAAGTAVIVKGTTGDFHANSTLYSITASQQNSTLIANAKANQIIVAGGNENILTGGKGNDTFKFTAGGGIVTDYGIGATKGGNGKALSTASGTDIVKVDGTVKKIFFERDASTKKSATFTATIIYTDDNDADQVIVLKDIVKKPTKTGKSPIYQTNDVAAATLKIWDTSSGKQSVLSATKLKKFFCDDDSDDAFTSIIKEKTDYLVNISEGNTPENNPFDVTATPSDGEEISGVEDD